MALNHEYFKLTFICYINVSNSLLLTIQGNELLKILHILLNSIYTLKVLKIQAWNIFSYSQNKLLFYGVWYSQNI